jgi:hypothetical protein
VNLTYFHHVAVLVMTVCYLAFELDGRQKPVRDLGNVEFAQPGTFHYFSLGGRYSCTMLGGEPAPPHNVKVILTFQRTNVWNDVETLGIMGGSCEIGYATKLTVRNFANGIVTGVRFTPTK